MEPVNLKKDFRLQVPPHTNTLPAARPYPHTLLPVRLRDNYCSEPTISEAHAHSLFPVPSRPRPLTQIIHPP